MLHKFKAGWKKVYGEQCIARCTTFRCCQRYEEGRVNIKDLPRSGQAHVFTNSATTSAVDELIRQHSRISTREIAVELSISKGTVHRIIHKRLRCGKVCVEASVRESEVGEIGRLPDPGVSTLNPSTASYTSVSICQWRLFIVALFHMNCS
ncbi:hypothetical protein AVEN_273793-1 [Araneus ventricosus]|uniref:Uncharacterized protein n=1 Tax=Araneus ventricosus TaxID=182803 RepID=A0A4Y2UYC6_ARAVE|nr:hypothetical protein AVEN_98787-1 [Araneus ventricosus]GBO16673.1 hypothetical protein AVEN_155502-1 [Araneus ventricosus]GBO16683.1 hypothetical protein AVEN_157602-1 [Araneus ventricosus]GBO16690.1 hypothetical protein AVEN_273793-1 [Araneus ventricosus]